MSQLTEEQLRKRKRTNIAILTSTLVLGVIATITVLVLGDVAGPDTPASVGRTEYVPSKNIFTSPVSTTIPPTPFGPTTMLPTPRPMEIPKIPPTPTPRLATPGPVQVPATPAPRPSYRQAARALWAELQKMRTDPEFLQCGYGAGCGPGAAWQRRVKNLNEQGGRPLFAQYGFVVTDLLSIGMDYMEGRPGDIRLEARVKEGLGLR